MIPDNFYEWPPSERREWLKANADQTQREKTVFKDLNPNQIDELESRIARESVKLAEVQKEYDEVKTGFNETMKPMKESLKHNVQTLRTGQEEITTDIFYIADYDNGRMIGYAPDGVEVENRRLREDEMQSSIHSMSRVK